MSQWRSCEAVSCCPQILPLLVEGRFDIDRMLHMLEEVLDRALKDGYTGLWATGDMSREFGQGREFSKLLEYEWRLEELFQACRHCLVSASIIGITCRKKQCDKGC